MPQQMIQCRMSEIKPMAELNPWHPISDPVDLKILGKLAEELGECTAAVARCIIQGVDEAEPVTGKANRRWIEEEIADVMAAFSFVIGRFGLDEKAITARANTKAERLKTWHDMT